MLAKFFSWEIFLFTTTNYFHAGLVIVGLLVGVVLRNFAVRRRDEFRDVLVGLFVIWLGFHIINYFAQTRVNMIVLSMLSCLAPVSTFAIISFLLVHTVKILKGDV